MGCNCGKRGNVVPPANCSNTTAQALSLYLNAYQRVQDENLYIDLSFSESYVQQQMALINITLTAKQSDSTSCTNSQFYEQWENDYASISLL